MSADCCPHGLARDRSDYRCDRCGEMACPECGGIGTIGAAQIPPTWQKERPTTPGWYWVTWTWPEPNGTRHAMPCRIDQKGDWQLFEAVVVLGFESALWSPITQPELPKPEAGT